jgi:predicted SAM-dependent methyltransferase
MKLHLGCANKHIANYINIDARNLEGVDIIDDVATLESQTPNTIDVIYASHVLEHFGRHKYINILRRWYELLKKDGILRLSVPDFEKVVEHYNTNRNLPILRGFLYGGQTYDHNFHYCAWDYVTLADDLKSVGFCHIEKYDWRCTDHSHIDDYSQCYLPHMDKSSGMLLSLNVEAKK